MGVVLTKLHGDSPTTPEDQALATLLTQGRKPKIRNQHRPVQAAQVKQSECHCLPSALMELAPRGLEHWQQTSPVTKEN